MYLNLAFQGDYSTGTTELYGQTGQVYDVIGEFSFWYGVYRLFILGFGASPASLYFFFDQPAENTPMMHVSSATEAPDHVVWDQKQLALALNKGLLRARLDGLHR